MKKEKTGNRRNRLLLAAVVLLALAGIGFLLYPTIANYVNNREFKKVIEGYQTEVAQMQPDVRAEMLEAARAYNARLAVETPFIADLTEERRQQYESLLDITGTGIMGYVEVPAAEIYLPIYHGTEDAVLASGAGHLEGSSLPVGGESVHTVLSGHSGLSSARLFSDIDILKEGDRFTLHVLNETLMYEVDRIQVILPEELNDYLTIETGNDSCTLMTCTPYGVNSHRLLVHGHRVETENEDGTEPPVPAASQTAADGRIWQYIGIPIAILAAILIVVVIIWRKMKKQP